MAWVEGIHICIPQCSQRAEDVIRSMEALLDQRKRGEISRGTFLVAWGKKRRALALTRDYIELRQVVQAEARGVCQVCLLRTGDHLHHLLPVAFRPRQALRRSNVKWVCTECHPDEDVEARRRVTQGGRNDKAGRRSEQVTRSS